ncbi:TPA: hypothetical protein ACNAEZ_000863 [Citrobacter farmeri]
MKPKTLKEIIDTTSGLLTGFLSTILLYVFKNMDWLGQYKEFIPTIVGVVVLFASLLIISINKRKIDKKEKEKNAEYKNEIKEKINTYSRIINEQKEDCAYKKAAEEHLISLLKKDMNGINEIEVEIEALRRDSTESETLMVSYMEKIKSAITKQERK